jgi:hypothetical protein
VHIAVNETGVTNGVNGRTLRVVSATSGAAVPGSLSQTGPTTWTFNPSGFLVTGDRYTLSVSGSIRDLNGNLATVAGSPVRVSTTADSANGAVHYSSGWVTHKSTNAIGSSYREGSRGASLSVLVAGSKVLVYGCKGPGFHSLAVQIDGVTRATASETQSFTKCGVLLYSAAVTTAHVHTVRLVASGGPAAFDAVKVS